MRVDLGFEKGTTGALPARWFVPTKGWRGELCDQDASRGERSAKLSLSGESEAPFGNMMRMMDATEYRGKRVRFSAKVRVEGKGATAMMWLRVDRPGGKMGFFDNMANRPVRSSKWTDAIIEGEIESDAERLALGVMSHGGGTVFIDDMQLMFSAGSPVQTESPPRAATPRGLANLQAAARLLAYVRFFHPSDETAAVQAWEHFAVELMEAAEPAENAEQLADRLQQAFAPIAPAMVVWAGSLDAGPPIPPAPPKAKLLTYWVHYGAGRIATPPSIYSSLRKRVPVSATVDGMDATEALRSAAARASGSAGPVEAPESPDALVEYRSLPRAAPQAGRIGIQRVDAALWGRSTDPEQPGQAAERNGPGTRHCVLRRVPGSDRRPGGRLREARGGQGHHLGYAWLSGRCGPETANPSERPAHGECQLECAGGGPA